MSDTGHYRYLLAGHRVEYTICNSGTSGTNSYTTEEVTVDDEMLENISPVLFGKLSKILSNNKVELANAKDYNERAQFYWLLSSHATEDGVCVLD